MGCPKSMHPRRRHTALYVRHMAAAGAARRRTAPSTSLELPAVCFTSSEYRYLYTQTEHDACIKGSNSILIYLFKN